jgi:hypothetical protein
MNEPSLRNPTMRAASSGVMPARLSPPTLSSARVRTLCGRAGRAAPRQSRSTKHLCFADAVEPSLGALCQTYVDQAARVRAARRSAREREDDLGKQVGCEVVQILRRDDLRVRQPVQDPLQVFQRFPVVR